MIALDNEAIGKLDISKLTESEVRLFEKTLERPELLHRYEVDRLAEICKAQQIDYRLPEALRKASEDTIDERYRGFLAGRDVRDIGDADFDKASRILTSEV